MNLQINAALRLHEFLAKHLELEYVIIGGIALQFWGEPRFTHDVDITVQSKLDITDLVNQMTEAFESRVSDPYKFVKDTGMILLSVEGVDIDISIALEGYEEVLFARNQSIEAAPDRVIKICSAEDLIIHKALAGRPQDSSDIQSVIYRQGDDLDLRYIRSWLKEFSSAVMDDSILERFEQAWKNR
jgi:predicted nucleotidyltransferase